MKNIHKTLGLLLCALSLSSCEALYPEGMGKMIISFDSTAATKAVTEIDTDDYMLSVSNSSGKTIFEGAYCESPAIFEIPAGSYTVSAMSCIFEEPCYDKPQYGDTKVVVVKSGETISVGLNCVQLNSGLSISVDDSFRESFPDGELYLSGIGGELAHDYNEKRTAFFKPGSIKVDVYDGTVRQTLFSRTLKARQVLSISLASAVSSPSGGISIQVDTTRNYLDDNYIYGEQKGYDIESALSVTDARDCPGTSDIWVCGYIVGCATGSSSYCFEPPFTKETNLILGLRSNTIDKEYCLSVELRSGVIRDELNLMSNPDLRGRKIYLKGDLVSSYFGIPGLKNLEEYSF